MYLGVSEMTKTKRAKEDYNMDNMVKVCGWAAECVKEIQRMLKCKSSDLTIYYADLNKASGAHVNGTALVDGKEHSFDFYWSADPTENPCMVFVTDAD